MFGRRKTFSEQLAKIPIEEIERLNEILENAMEMEIVSAIETANEIIEFIMKY